MDRRLYLDISRLIARRYEPAATGIDRTEIAYARHLSKVKGARFVRAMPPQGLVDISNETVSTLMWRTEQRWTDPPTSNLEERRRVVEFIDKRNSVTFRQDVEKNRRQIKPDTIRFFSWRRSLQRSTKNDAYFHVSHSGLDHNCAYRTYSSFEARKFFYLHDLIPITHPEYARPQTYQQHVRRVNLIASIADVVMVNSLYTKDVFSWYLTKNSLRKPPTSVLPLGVDHMSVTEERPTFCRPYFLYVSTIEGRKNHAFLLTVWRDLIEKYGDKAPMLLLVGKRGWECESAIDLLERCGQLCGHVFELGSISNDVLTYLLNGATGCVVPSFAEGFSLSLVEANIRNIPTLASDIPVHREVAEGNITFISPTDGVGWEKRIMSTVEQSFRRGSQFVARKNTKFNWAAHFRILETLF